MATRTDTPILYSFRRCPYAIRARMALYYSGIRCQLREVLLKDKPAEMLAISAKGTVPVLLVGNEVIDESLAVMRWALSCADPQGWDSAQLASPLVLKNDGEFKHWLDRYKYFDRFPEHPQDYYFHRACEYLQLLESRMVGERARSNYLISPAMSAIDVAIFPFIRQFALVDRVTFDALPLPRLQGWLERMLKSDLFNSVMHKYPQWAAGQTAITFGAKAA